MPRCGFCGSEHTPGIDRHMAETREAVRTDLELMNAVMKLGMEGEIRGVEPPEVEHWGDGNTKLIFSDSQKEAVLMCGNFVLTPGATEAFIDALRKRGN